MLEILCIFCFYDDYYMKMSRKMKFSRIFGQIFIFFQTTTYVYVEVMIPISKNKME